MNNLFIDTNIVLDLLAQREPFYKSASHLFSLADTNKIVLSVSALSIANINYILTRLKSAAEAKEILRRLRVLIDIIPLTDKIIDLSLNDASFSDFEDALQYYSAIESHQNMIITRNLKDFKSARIPIMTAEGFLVRYQH